MEPIRFSSKSAEYSFLSNFHAAPFTVRGREWPTVEHYFQAMKTFDTAEQERVRAASTPAKAKALGKKVSLRVAWDDIEEYEMLKALREKFHYHSELGRRLIATGEAPLIEATPRDYHWGAGAKGTGKNRLGHLLMQVRKELWNEMMRAAFHEASHAAMAWELGSDIEYIDRDHVQPKPPPEFSLVSEIMTIMAGPLSDDTYCPPPEGTRRVSYNERENSDENQIVGLLNKLSEKEGRELPDDTRGNFKAMTLEIMKRRDVAAGIRALALAVHEQGKMTSEVARKFYEEAKAAVRQS